MKKLITFLLTLLMSQTGFATEPRLSLTAADGSGLELHQFKARVVLEGFLAFTELEMVFYNPENRQREGRFQIILPDNAAISRFAMKIGDRLQEGEIVEKQLARRAYEDFLHRRQDPALLETDSGNRFNARIFPIAPKSAKLLVLSYSQRLNGLENEYILPLKGLPKLKQLSVKVFYDRDNFSTAQLGELTGTVSKRQILSIEKSDYQPAVDFRMPYRAAIKGDLVMQSEQLVAARIVPFTASTTTDKASPQSFDNLILLIDTSASQAPYLADSLKRLETLLPQLQVATLRIYSFDQMVREFMVDPTNNQPLFTDFPAPLGASRLDAAIETLKALKLEKSRLLLISDTVVTAGETSATALAEQLKTVPWLERVDILVPSYHSDQQIAHRLAKAGHSPGIVAPLTLSDEHLIRKLTHSVYADQPIKVSGSTWYWPEQVDALQTDEPLIVFAELSPEETSKSQITIQVGDKKWTLTSQPANPILLKREWVRARLDKLLDIEDKTSDPDLKNAFHNEVTNLSVKQRVLSPYTSLLVLETEDDYRRYNIDRNGLADIMTIGVDGLTVIKRAGVETDQPTPEIAMPDETALPNLVDKGVTDVIILETTDLDTDTDDADVETISGVEIEALSMPTALSVALSVEEEDSEADTNRPNIQYFAAAHRATRDMADNDSEQTYSAGREESIQPDEAGSADADSRILSMPEAPMAEPQPVYDIIPESNAAAVPPPPPPPPPAMMRMEVSVDDEERRQDETDIRAAIEEVQRAEQELENASRRLAELSPQASDKERQQAERTIRNARRTVEIRRERVVELTEMIRQRAQVQETVPQVSPWIGRYGEFRALLDKADVTAAGELAQTWHQENLADVMALVALGEWYEKTGETAQAARAYGSLIDYFPARADIRRWTAERLLSLQSESWLSIDSLNKAVEQRADHPSGHYLLALAYWEAGESKQAVETLQAAIKRNYPRFDAATRILTETLALMLTQLEQQQQLEVLFPGKTLDWEKMTQPQLRLVLMWETDANDVDFHIYDNHQNHAFYRQPNLASGGTLYADITTGYGPECFTISEPNAFPYRAQAHYYRMGPMGYGMGVLHVLQYDPKTGLNSEFRPFLVMKDGAFVELGTVKSP